MTKPIRVSEVLHRRIKAHAASLGMGLGEYVELTLSRTLDSQGAYRILLEERQGRSVPVPPRGSKAMQYAESEA